MTDNGERHDGEDRGSHAERRELNRGFGDSLARAFELVLTPTIFGFLGYLIDRWLGTTPIFMLGLGLFTVVYVAWRMMTGYDAAMREHEARFKRPYRNGRA